ncbi:MAG TPA: hypothetical protein VHD90_19065 [Phototrophicaceae bacterium]|nr:hypothetical protein [Phototrophicaceae bacterium]
MSDQPNETASEKKAPLDEFLRHQQRALEETGKAIDALFPPGFKEHSEQAGREFIGGMKVLADAVIDGLQKASKDFDKNFNRREPPSSGSGDAGGDRPSSTGTTKVKVQVD